MANYLLEPVFKYIFDRKFNPSSFEDRLEMQKSVYILQNMGISVGDYNFLWYKHGPYSQTLQDDIVNLSRTSPDVNIKFSSDAKKELDALKAVIEMKDIEYSQSEWLECLGSILYIKDNLLSRFSTDENILTELVSRKSHLNKTKENKLALNVLKQLSL